MHENLDQPTPRGDDADRRDAATENVVLRLLDSVQAFPVSGRPAHFEILTTAYHERCRREGEYHEPLTSKDELVLTRLESAFRLHVTERLGLYAGIDFGGIHIHGRLVIDRADRTFGSFLAEVRTGCAHSILPCEGTPQVFRNGPVWHRVLTTDRGLATYFYETLYSPDAFMEEAGTIRDLMVNRCTPLKRVADQSHLFRLALHEVAVKLETPRFDPMHIKRSGCDVGTCEFSLLFDTDRGAFRAILSIDSATALPVVTVNRVPWSGKRG